MLIKLRFFKKINFTFLENPGDDFIYYMATIFWSWRAADFFLEKACHFTAVANIPFC